MNNPPIIFIALAIYTSIQDVDDGLNFGLYNNKVFGRPSLQGEGLLF